VFAPSLNVPAGTVKLAVPLASDSCALYEPLESVTVPVGVACPLVPDTATVTTSLSRSVMVTADGVTVTVGVTATAIKADPVALW
jgi:hypothetical protein